MNEFTTTEDMPLHHRAKLTRTQPFLFVVLHCDKPSLGGARYGLMNIDEVTIGRGSEREVRRNEPRRLELRLPSAKVSKTHARLIRRCDVWFLDDLGSKNGLLVNGERVSSTQLWDGDFIEIGSVILRFRSALACAPSDPEDLDGLAIGTKTPGYSSLVPTLATQLDALARLAPSLITVQFQGETGTGKEVLAKGLHLLSERTGPWVPVNCGGLTPSLIEGPLLGPEKDPNIRTGRAEWVFLRQAQSGTLFLDEMGDLSRPAQATLLRALQEREVVLVGATAATKVDVRVMAATNKSLETLCLEGEFREDLLARLSGYRFTAWPLRERLEDMGLLMAHLLRASDMPSGPDLTMTIDAARRLCFYAWPQNIRELDTVLKVAAALTQDGLIEVSHLGESLTRSSPKRSIESDIPAEPEQLHKQLEQLLQAHRGNVASVARAIGKSRMQVHRWMQKFGIDPDQFRT